MTSYKRLSFVGSVINTVKAMTGKALYLVCNCCEQRKNSKEGKERRREKEREKEGREGGRKEKERKGRRKEKKKRRGERKK